ncbi:hypothetical protein JXB01_02730 [Candidatus Micrarchaeota archaeon]|nr:hypothetical protein [Candidatus Micrarchaeota archaeon]
MKGTKINDLRKLSESELSKKLEEMNNALLTENTPSTKTRPLKKAVARIKTIFTERKKQGGGVK